MFADENFLLKDFLDIIPDGTIAFDVHGNIRLINKAAVNLLGYNSISVLGKPIYDLTSAASKEDFKRSFNEALTTGVGAQKKIQLYDVKGNLRSTDFSFAVLRGSDKKPLGVISTIRDSKEMRTIEKELHRIQEVSKNVLNSASLGVVATDERRSINFVSSTLSEILETSAEELVGENLINLFPDQLRFNDKLNELIEHGTSFEYELSKEIDGAVHTFLGVFTSTVDQEGKSGIMGVFSDVTTLKDAERQLKDSNALLMEHTKDLEHLVGVISVLSSSLDMGSVYKRMVDASIGNVRVDSSAFFEHSSDDVYRLAASAGMDSDAVSSLNKSLNKKDFLSFLKGLKAPKIIKNISDTFPHVPELTNSNLSSVVFLPLKIKGESLGVLAGFSRELRTFRRSDIEIIQSIGTSAALAVENAQLYSELKDFAAELEKRVKERTAELAATNIELEHSNRLKDLFIDIVRHDLMNPAMIIRNYVELAMNKASPEAKNEILGKVHKTGNRVIDMIQDASTLARLESSQEVTFKELDLVAIARETVEEMTSNAEERGMKLIIDAMPQAKTLASPLIQDVFMNFVSNAIKYSLEKTTVTVRIKDKNDRWKVSVVDQGEGIPDEHKEAVFSRFTRLEKGSVKGTGLGLAIVKKIVELHKGEVWVEDAPGGGSAFIFEIPKAPEERAKKA